MKQLKHCVKLRSQVKIYIPSTINVNQEFDSSKIVDETLTFLSKCFNGATSSEALGAWVTSNGELVKERVNICFSFATQEQLNDSIDHIYNYCLDIKKRMNQEAISLEVNGELYFI